MIFYFSGTGNSRWIASVIARSLNSDLVDIAQVVHKSSDELTYNIEEAELLGFVFPIYGWDMPAIVRSFISKASFVGSSPITTFFVSTCGDDIGKTFNRMSSLLASRHLALRYAYSVIMPNTYTALPFFDVDSDELRRSKLREAFTQVKIICEELKSGKKDIVRIKPGAMAWIKTNILGSFFRSFLMKDDAFRVTSACTSCGLCKKSCPVGNISLDETSHPQWHHACTACLACYHSCPQNAIQYASFTKGKGQYLFKRYLDEVPSDK